MTSQADHSVYVEFGTGQRGEASNTIEGITYSQDWKGMKAQPFFIPAFIEVEKQTKNKFEELHKNLGK